jgi:N-acetylglucosamine kinase-like BadF-type ATPase
VKLVLAVDGGGAKTDLALLDSDGGLLSFVRGSGSSADYLGVDGSIGVLDGLLTDAIGRAGLDPPDGPVADTAFFLLAGADSADERATLRARLEQLRWSQRLVVDNDTLALLRAGSDRGWGIAVVCGAGINGFGLAPDGREARFLSLGPISGDWGGGAHVGLAALGAAVRAVEGRGPRTVLQTAVPTHFGLADPLEVSRSFQLGRLEIDRLRELAPVVLAVSDQDPVAAGIVGRLADEVTTFAVAAMRRLELTDADPDVVLGGGLLRAVAPAVIETITRGVRDVAPNARVLVAPSEPIVGAALLGLDDLGAEPAAKARARDGLDAAVSAHERAAVTSA